MIQLIEVWIAELGEYVTMAIEESDVPPIQTID